jgi:RNA polymerase sigma-70 factor (ECF subfamily)
VADCVKFGIRDLGFLRSIKFTPQELGCCIQLDPGVIASDSKMNEAAAIRAAQKGKLSAFNQLVLVHQRLAYNVAYRILNDTDLAADATQEAFIKAFKSINQYRGGTFKSWLMRIVTNTCYDQLRYDQRRPTEALEPEDADGDYVPHLVDPTARPEDTTMRRELGEMLQASLTALPPDQRVVLILSDVEGFSYQEIADITDSNLGTVKSRLNRARAKLREVLLQQELLPAQYRLRSNDS